MSDKSPRCHNCDRKADLICKHCGLFWCVTCHQRYGKSGFFKGECGRCGHKAVVAR